jgi:hypothetical protein
LPTSLCLFLKVREQKLNSSYTGIDVLRFREFEEIIHKEQRSKFGPYHLYSYLKFYLLVC